MTNYRPVAGNYRTGLVARCADLHPRPASAPATQTVSAEVWSRPASRAGSRFTTRRHAQRRAGGTFIGPNTRTPPLQPGDPAHQAGTKCREPCHSSVGPHHRAPGDSKTGRIGLGRAGFDTGQKPQCVFSHRYTAETSDRSGVSIETITMGSVRQTAALVGSTKGLSSLRPLRRVPTVSPPGKRSPTGRQTAALDRTQDNAFRSSDRTGQTYLCRKN